MHGKLMSIDKCDVLCICGDVIPLNIQRIDEASLDWLSSNFLEWVNSQPCEKVLLIGGNHDFAIYRNPDAVKNLFSGTKVTYLLDEEYVYTDSEGKKVKFYGSPWCHKFYNWAYMDYDEDELEKVFLKMPADVDVLLTHDCPYGCCDIIRQNVWWADGKHIGSIGLANAVGKKKPKVMLTGHLHSTDKDGGKLCDTMVYNTSVVDEHYELVYAPHYFEVSDDHFMKLLNEKDFVNIF